MLRDFEDCIEIEHGKRKFNFDKIYAVFNNELNDKNRLLSKVRNIWFFSPLILSKWELLSFLCLYIFEKSVLIFQFFNDKMHNYLKHNCEFRHSKIEK